MPIHATTLPSPAKINLFLRVLGRRADGYHDIETLMVCVGLFDTLRMAVGVDSGPVTVRCAHPRVPEDETNLAARAARLFFQKYGAPKATAIDIDKQIPVGAGLGGGSSNAAAVLRGLNDHFRSPFSGTELAKMALSLGADVPFFLYGRPALATGIGERLAPVGPLPRLALAIVYPGVSVATASVYKNLNLGLTKKENQPKYFPLMANSAIERHLFNDLEAVTLQRHPEVAAAKAALVANGAKGALMSGSGSSVFGIFEDGEAARRACAAISRRSDWQFFTVDTLV